MKTQIVDSVVRRGGSVLAALAFAFVATSAHAVSIPINASSSCQVGFNCIGTSFYANTGNSYDFIFDAGTTSATGNAGTVTLASVPGGTTDAFLALDSDYPNSGFTGGPVMIDLTGLAAGTVYTVNFNTADAQQAPTNLQQAGQWVGPTDDKVTVCVNGLQCMTTLDVVDPTTGGSTPWVGQTYSFTAGSGKQTLSFLGIGGSDPHGSSGDGYHTSNVPAFALVDDITITPEPSSLMLLGTGLAGLGGLVRSRLSKRS